MCNIWKKLMTVSMLKDLSWTMSVIAQFWCLTTTRFFDGFYATIFMVYLIIMD